MNWRDFFGLLAAFLGLIGALFLSKSLVVLRPKTILYLTTSHSNIDYSAEQVASLVSQKADATVGIIYILIAFSIQIVSVMFIADKGPSVMSRWMAFWVIVAIMSITTITFSFINISIYN